MKKLVIILGLLAWSAPGSQAQNTKAKKAPRAASPSVRALDSQNGFGKATFGADISKFRDLELVRTDAATQTDFYNYLTDNLKVGSHKLTGITYGFYKDKLYYIELRMMGEANCRSIRELLSAQYGPSQSPGQAQTSWWLGQQVTLRYTEAPVGYATIVLGSNHLAEQRLAQRKAAGSPAA
ncbi:hypothetical protein SAMN00120144_3673 [Hymenobacter roseosalivarius DSM 11622]|uniref:Uncharacterized protein n=1 Tax=Hymenobacter roseosalivarius DSM 11622 TaxID=645990 RepID=A0A1W1W0B8_9BACT|nr:hypothetical protein [Hymenobacter roseosalivarius]SMB99026.1 hypothetical protein SAMN00120144_3673 [Hymenobacter roseosalivarius DSM 11622]